MYCETGGRIPARLLLPICEGKAIEITEEAEQSGRKFAGKRERQPRRSLNQISVKYSIYTFGMVSEGV